MILEVDANCNPGKKNQLKSEDLEIQGKVTQWPLVCMP